MAVPTAAFAGLKTGFESRRSPRASEIWTVTGNTSVAADTVAITTRMKKPALVIGAVSWTISGNVVTVALLAALAASETISIEIVGLPA